MRYFLYGLGLVVVLLACLLVWGMTLDPHWRVKRSIEIDEAPGPVFAYVSILENWPEWTAWTPEEYPNIKYVFSGSDWGVGATQSWHDGDMQGELQVTEFRPGEYMEYMLKMDPGNIRLRGSLEIEATDTGSILSWSCWGDAGDSPIDKLMMRGVYLPMIGHDFNRGLKKLRARFQQQDGE